MFLPLVEIPSPAFTYSLPFFVKNFVQVLTFLELHATGNRVARRATGNQVFGRMIDFIILVLWKNVVERQLHP